MEQPPDVKTARASSISWVVIVGAGLWVAAALTLLAAPFGYRMGVVPLRTALLTLLRWGGYAGAAAAGVSLTGLILTLMRPREARRGLSLALIGVLVGAVLFAIPARFRLGPPVPPIHDITTDTQDPPQFVAVVALNTPDRTVYEGKTIAVQQREAYPDLQPVILEMPAGAAFERALATVHEMGWDLVEANAAEGRIEATDTTFWFRFKDDVIIRVRPADGGSRVDVRSLSRVGGGDAGTNARRIRAYLSSLTD